MSTFVIGDLHGCLTPLKQLLDKVQFKPGVDKLWFVGDLINRGPQSLETLRFVRSLGTDAICVLGNHDLHLLAVIHDIRRTGGKDTLDDILAADDLPELTHWLRHQPLLHHSEELDVTMVHAGIHPKWDLDLAKAMAAEVEKALRSDRYIEFLERMYGNKPAKWSRKLGKHRRRRFAINAFTRMRFCTKKGELDFSQTCAPHKAPKCLVPWYQVPNRKVIEGRILFGHWSSHPGFAVSNVVPLDRGAVWGGSLVALALETGVTTTVDCSAYNEN